MLTKKYAGRFEFISLMGLAFIAILLARNAYLQLYEGDYYKKQADGNRIRMTPIMAPRGLIYDRNGVPLVNNRPGFTLAVNTREPNFTIAVARRLSEIIQVPEQEIIQRIEKNKDNFEPVLLKSDLSPQMVTAIEERRAELPGAMIVIQPLRTYLEGALAAHVLGYVGEISQEELTARKNDRYRVGSIVGKMGLEQYYDSILRGQDGVTRVEVDVAGHIVQEIGKLEPAPGHSIYLTIDLAIQKATERALDEQLTWLRKYGNSPQAFAAAVVVLDPRDGSVLALASRPAFDPNMFVSGISQKDWDAINNNPYSPMDNKAISGEYPPGSTFKVVTGTAALELGKVTPEERILDLGYHRLVPQKGNAGGMALGWIGFNEALTKSDNVYFYEMSYRVGIDGLEKYARGFGYGQAAGIDLFGESDGVVAGKEYKKQMFNEDWYLAETFDAAIGQGFQLATPLQMAAAVSAVANGGQRYQPQLLRRVVSDKGEPINSVAPKETGRLPMSTSTNQLVKKALRGVAQEGGSAWQLADFPVPLAGKTGTSENSRGRDHALFVAYAPADTPEIAVAVLVEQGGFGSVAAIPIAKNIFAEYFNINQNKAGKNK